MTEQFGMTEKMLRSVEECPCKVSAAYRRKNATLIRRPPGILPNAMRIV
jgi:hypothetical protein